MTCLWGPYIWAPACDSGVTNGAGFCYDRADFQADAIHPATGARNKVATMIQARFLAEPWYRAQGASLVPPPIDEDDGGDDCTSNADCFDGDPCTRETCADGQCRPSEPVANCTSDDTPCQRAEQCDDGDPETMDGCLEGVCAHRPRR